MSDLLEKSLDEIIGAKKNDNNGRRRGPKNTRSRGVSKPDGRRGRGSRGRGSGSHYRPSPRLFEDPEVKKLSQGKPYVKITNLHYDLTEKDIHDLFSQVGEVLFTRIEFDTNGRSLGVAYVGFVNPDNASIAIEKFDGRKAAGKIISVSNGIPLQDRIGGGIASSGKSRGSRKRNPRPPKPTLEDLDAELESYRNQKDEPQVNEQPSNDAMDVEDQKPFPAVE